jgi:hypothetical protein
VAGIASVLRALGRAVWRDLRTLQSIMGNNFCLFVLLLMQQVESALFFLLILGLLLLFPLSADPLRKIPADRLKLWPLSPKQRLALRFASVTLSPVAWITVGLLLKTQRLAVAAQFLVAAVVVQILVALGARVARKAPDFDLLRRIPAAPGMLGELIRKDLRQMLSTLDPYVALALTVSAIGYRIFSKAPDASALSILTVIVVLAMSTYAQCFFGLDGPAGIDRYRLLPLAGWQILLAKDFAFLVIAIPLVLPLRPLAGLGSALVALAIGHHTSVFQPIPQHRWRFTSGVVVPNGLIQSFFLISAGVAVDRQSPLFLIPCVAAYLGSLWYYGRAWTSLLH